MLSYRARRFVLLAAGALLAMAAPAACGSLSEGNVLVGDGGIPDSSFDGESTDAAPPPSAVFVQASPSLHSVRLCWALGETVSADLPFPSTGVVPASNYPGIPAGGTAALSDATALIGQPLTFYAIDAYYFARLASSQDGTTCDRLICGSDLNPAAPCLRPTKDYAVLAPLASGALQPTANLVAIVGCQATALDSNASVERCGASWDPVGGNLHSDTLAFQPAPALSSGQIALQAVDLSPGLTSLFTDAGGAVISLGYADSGAPSELAQLTAENQFQPSSPAIVDAGSALATFGQLGFSVDVAGTDAAAGHLWMSLAEALQLVDPTQDPVSYFGRLSTYAVAVVGDPNAPRPFGGSPAGIDGGYDGTGLHLLILPSATARIP